MSRPAVVTLSNIWFAFYSFLIGLFFIVCVVSSLVSAEFFAESAFLQALWQRLGVYDLADIDFPLLFGSMIWNLVVAVILWVGIGKKLPAVIQLGCVVGIIFSTTFGQVLFGFALIAAFLPSYKKYYSDAVRLKYPDTPTAVKVE